MESFLEFVTENFGPTESALGFHNFYQGGQTINFYIIVQLSQIKTFKIKNVCNMYQNTNENSQLKYWLNVKAMFSKTDITLGIAFY